MKKQFIAMANERVSKALGEKCSRSEVS